MSVPEGKYINHVFSRDEWRDKEICNVSFTHCQFLDCKLEGAVFRNCTFSQCAFVRCCLDGVDFTKDTQVSRSEIIGCNVPDLKIKILSETDALFSDAYYAKNVHIQCDPASVPLYHDFDTFFISEVYKGGQGTTYVVEPRVETNTYFRGRKYVVKLLHFSNKESLQKIERECENIKNIRSPYVAGILANKINHNSKLYYLVMEHAPGCTLWRILRHGHTLSTDAKRSICVQAFKALRDIHASNIVHRDINPKNLIIHFVDGDEETIRLKIVDFGFSRLLASGRVDGYTLSRPFFAPGYQPLEVFDTNTYSFQSDIFSLGISLFQMWTGRHPFSALSDGGEAEYKRRLRVARKKGPTGLDRIKEPAFQDIMRRCLQIEKRARPATALEVLNMLLRQPHEL